MQEMWWDTFEKVVLDPSAWINALQTLADATGAARAQLIGFGGSQATPFNWITNISDYETQLFAQFDGHSPKLNFRIAANEGAGGAIVSETDYERVKPQLEDDCYLDFCEETRMPLGCQTILTQQETGSVGLALLRCRSDGPTDAAVRTVFAHGTATARVAVRMQVALEQQGAALITGALDTMSIACLLFDRRGRVCAATPTAEALLATPGPLSLRDRQLAASDTRVGTQIDQALRRIIDPEGPLHARLQIPATAGIEVPLRLDLFRTRQREWSFGFQPSVIGVLRGAGGAIEHAVLAAAFGFTPAESAIAGLLVQGRDRREIAAHRHVTAETLRGQLKTLYGKTGCSREAELVALLAQLRD